MLELPTILLRYLPDSEMKVLSWDGEAGVLLIQLVKEIGPETGVLRFDGVTHVNLPPRLAIGGIGCGKLEDLPSDFLEKYRHGDKSLGPQEVAYIIQGSWGEEFFVIAERIDYTVTNNS